VDAHRTVAYVAGAYVKQGAVVSTRYTTVSMLRTIEELLGTGRMGLNDAAAAPMADAFTMDYKPWSYAARVPAVLRTTQLPLPPAASSSGEDTTANAAYAHPRHTVVWWAAHSRGQDFSVEDDLDTGPLQSRALAGPGAKGFAISGKTCDRRGPARGSRAVARELPQAARVFVHAIVESATLKTAALLDNRRMRG